MMKFNFNFNLKSTLLATVLMAMSSVALADDTHTHWGYTGHHSPEEWGELSSEFATCSNGENQSPINIVPTVDGNLPEMKSNYVASSVGIINNGHTIQVNYPKHDHNQKEKDQKTNTLTIKDEIYHLHQFHFHVPSENHVNGKSFPLEAHLVHRNDKGQLAVLAILYELSSQDNEHLQAIWNEMPEQKSKEIPLKQKFNAKNLLPNSLDYYRFSGSLTTPPCSEGVAWFVLKSYDTISEKQVNKFRKVVGENNRPLQPLNARVVVE